MPLPISSVARAESLAAGSDSAFLICLEIIVPGLDEAIRVVRNNEDITWRGETFQAFPFEIDEISEASGEVPRVDLRVSNASRAMAGYLLQYDVYTKTNGYEAITVNLYVVNSKNLSSDDPETEHQFELIQPKISAEWATFTLGASNPFNMRFPVRRMLKNFCGWEFKGLECGYSGSESACDRTLTRCRELLNSPRFGGFVALGGGGLRIG